MAIPLHQITFEFSDESKENVPKEFLSGKPVEQKKAKPKSNRGRKSLKEWAAAADAINILPDDVLFMKQYYAIGQVADMFQVNPSLLRYWEGEFNMELRKNRKGDRFFTPQDIKYLQLIYDLLRRRKFTIEGAKDYLKKSRQAKERFELTQSLQRLKTFLLELKAHL